MDWNKKDFLTLLRRTVDVLAQEPSFLRPYNQQGLPGGLLRLDPALPTVLVADLHARYGLIPKLLCSPLQGKSLQSLLDLQKAQLVFLGDYPHSEENTQARWQKALSEFREDFSTSTVMDEEMTENRLSWRALCELKLRYPLRVHFLKGNHENVTNQRGQGNRVFSKFALEGAMVKRWIEVKLGSEVLRALDRFERALPLALVCGRFAASHAPPAQVFSALEVIEKTEQAIEGLTWTRPLEVSKKAIRGTLKQFWGHSAGLWFAGHNPTQSGVEWDRAKALVHFHDPYQPIALCLYPGKAFSPSGSVIRL